MTDRPDLYLLQWVDFDHQVQRLASLIERRYAGIYGVPRGGLVPAVALSHLTGIPLVSTIDPDTLIVDDIADSGKTLAAYPEHDRLVLVRRFGSQCHAKAAKYLPAGDNRWVVFPWEKVSDAGRDQSEYVAKRG